MQITEMENTPKGQGKNKNKGKNKHAKANFAGNVNAKQNKTNKQQKFNNSPKQEVKKGKTNLENTPKMKNQESRIVGVKVKFPYGIKCYKSVLQNVLQLAENVSKPENMVLTFSSEEQAKKSVDAIKKIKVGKMFVNAFALQSRVKSYDPLKAVFRIPFKVDINPEDVKNYYNATTVDKLHPNKNQSMIVLTFPNEKLAKAALAKVYKHKNQELRLFPFFTWGDSENNADTSSPQKRKKDASTMNEKKAKKIKVEAKQEEEEDDEDDDDDQDDDDDEEMKNDDDEEEDDDDDEEEEDDDDDEEEEDDDDDDEEEDDDDDDDDDDE